MAAEAEASRKRPYYLKKSGDFWYYRLNPESGLTAGENLNYYTTGCRSRPEAEAFMADMLGEQPETPTFRLYAEPFFLWGQCPHIRRLQEETGRLRSHQAGAQGAPPQAGAGVFTVEELKGLFPERGYGPWKDARDYTCFFLAAVSGARRGELLVLRWRHLDFEGQYLNITEAWKGRYEIGGTKSGRARIVPLSARIFEKFNDLRLEYLHVQPDDFLVCYDDGSRVGETWWHERFKG